MKTTEQESPCGGNIELIRQGDVCKTCQEYGCGFHRVTMQQIQDGTIFDRLTKGYESAEQVDLFGNPIPTPAAPALQLTLFDPADYLRESSGIPAVVCRENGEKASGQLDMSWAKKPPKYMKPTYVFVAETGSSRRFVLPQINARYSL